MYVGLSIRYMHPERNRPENGRGDPRSRFRGVFTGRLHPCHGRYEKRSRTKNQRFHGKRRMKKAKKTAPPAGTAPAGGGIYLPSLSVPGPHLSRILPRTQKIRLKSEDFSRIWSECRDSNPRPLGPEGWSDIFHGHFRAFQSLSARKNSQRHPFRHG